jgi:TPR repeat protein
VTTYKHNPKLNTLKAQIKDQAEQGHSLREEARTLTGPDRHVLKVEANDIGSSARLDLLAYGYLRGRTIEQMESPTSRLENLPHLSAITDRALRYFRPQAAEETPDEYAAAKNELKNLIEADWKAWRKQVTLSGIEREARKRLSPQAA